MKKKKVKNYKNDEKSIKIVKKMRTSAKAAYFLTLLLFSYYTPYFWKKSYLNSKNLRQNPIFLSFLSFKSKYLYYFYLL